MRLRGKLGGGARVADPARGAGRRKAIIVGRKWPRWVTIPGGGDAGGRAGDDEIATAAKLAAILRSRLVVQIAIWRRPFHVIRGTGSSARSSSVNGLTAVVVRRTLTALRLSAQAFADRIARRRGLDGRYQLANGMGAMLDSDDALTRHEWLIAPLLLQGSHSPDARILQAVAVDIDALTRACPQLLQQSDIVEWDDAQGTLKAFRRSQIGKLTWRRSRWQSHRKRSCTGRC